MTLRQYKTVCKAITKRIKKLGGDIEHAKGLKFNGKPEVYVRATDTTGHTRCKLGNGIGLHKVEFTEGWNKKFVLDGVNNPVNPTLRFHNMGPAQICVYEAGKPSVDIAQFRFDSHQLKILTDAIKSAAEVV